MRIPLRVKWARGIPKTHKLKLPKWVSILSSRPKRNSNISLHLKQNYHVNAILGPNAMWVRGRMAVNVGYEFRDRGSIPRSQILTLGKLANLHHSLNDALILD